MNTVDRRDLLKWALAAAPGLAAPPGRAAAPDGPFGSADLAAAWQRLFAPAPGERCAWSMRGTAYAHVDGLREFPVMAHNALLLCTASQSAETATVDWRTIGYFGDLERGAPATHWVNVFAATEPEVPRRIVEGPGRYRLALATAALDLQAERVRSNRCNLSGTVDADGTVSLTQIEGTLQGLPRLDGSLPPLDSPDLTERQTRLQLLAHRAADAPVRGFYTHVYDALPAWLGFGDRLGSLLVKGVMRKHAVDALPDPVMAAHLKRLFGADFAAARAAAPR